MMMIVPETGCVGTGNFPPIQAWQRTLPVTVTVESFSSPYPAIFTNSVLLDSSTSGLTTGSVAAAVTGTGGFPRKKDIRVMIARKLPL